jgi:hypothetical protein
MGENGNGENSTQIIGIKSRDFTTNLILCQIIEQIFFPHEGFL